MHWLAWQRLGTPKREGGLGFRDLESFNDALLGKQAWRILQTPNCLMTKVLKGRYFNDTPFLCATKRKKASYIWYSILQGRDLLKKGLRVMIGNGEAIDAWSDPWLPTHPPRAPIAKTNSVTSIKVKEWITNLIQGWDIQKLQELVVPEDVERIRAIKLCSKSSPDLLGWHYNKDGIYTVKSGYWLATHSGNQQAVPIPGDIPLKRTIWKLKTAPKIRHFLWKLISRILPTGENLRRRHLSSQSICRRCCQEEETTKHLFFLLPIYSVYLESVRFAFSIHH